jgi:hypothetical protein
MSSSLISMSCIRCPNFLKYTGNTTSLALMYPFRKLVTKRLFRMSATSLSTLEYVISAMARCLCVKSGRLCSETCSIETLKHAMIVVYIHLYRGVLCSGEGIPFILLLFTFRNISTLSLSAFYKYYLYI